MGRSKGGLDPKRRRKAAEKVAARRAGQRRAGELLAALAEHALPARAAGGLGLADFAPVHARKIVRGRQARENATRAAATNGTPPAKKPRFPPQPAAAEASAAAADDDEPPARKRKSSKGANGHGAVKNVENVENADGRGGRGGGEPAASPLPLAAADATLPGGGAAAALEGLGGAERARLLRYVAAREKDRLGLARDDAESDNNEAGPSAVGGGGGEVRGRPAGQCVVCVERTPAMQEARERLPIAGFEQEIMEAVARHDVVIVCGATGSGKTTQLPQFLYEAGFGTCRCDRHRGLVGVTEPRRLAATATAQRVAAELNVGLGGAVGFQVRHARREGPEGAVKFMTDGILLRELQEDFLLTKYSVVILDEAHERSVNTDVLVGLLARVVPLRAKLAAARTATSGGAPPLKLIIMSATLQVEQFVGNRQLFRAPPPVLSVPARQFPVTVHFARRTELVDYLGAAVQKALAVHRRLPRGHLLVFLTGQKEVLHVCRRLERALGGRAAAARPARRDAGRDATPAEDGGADALDAFGAEAAEFFSDDEADEDPAEDPRGLFSESDSEVEADAGAGGEGQGRPDPIPQKAVCLPLYAKLAPGEQRRAFEAAEALPADTRLIVVATNVAETSVTIPGVRYVVDCGRSKQKLQESATAGVARFQVGWISKASAEQRAGRAGRTGPGHCYRLYSAAVFDQTFPEHGEPEIRNTPLESVALQLRALGIDRPAAFPFPTPPAPAALRAAERCLRTLGAVDAATGVISPLGRLLAAFPVSPRHARMLLAVATLGPEEEEEEEEEGANAPTDAKAEKSKAALAPKVLGPALRLAVAAAAALSFEPPFQEAPGRRKDPTAPEAAAPEAAEDPRAALRATARKGSDVFEVVAALTGFEAAAAAGVLAGEAFCRRHALLPNAMREMALLRRQLAQVCGRAGAQLAGAPGEVGALARRLRRAVEAAGGERGLAGPLAPQPKKRAALAVRFAICQGWADQVARRRASAEASRRQVREGTAKAVRYASVRHPDRPVYLKKDSSLAFLAPEYVCYRGLLASTKRVYMQTATAVEAHWVPAEAEPEEEDDEPGPPA